ncbi:MAG TPA: hypothetical protein DCM28_09200 [Phycisphaerales bacterium]|nr:hypothetical protein [Phycisphaerales bacterium]HCD31006.1 hypothetical protein [Phycisphaerales bacterium]|tara:strand:+ start:4152 stop:4424 length:273 start_codon:yes stop_codon:yes gene_type:complete
MVGNQNNSNIRKEIKTLKRDLFTIKEDLEQISNTVVDESKQTFNEVKDKANHEITKGLKRARKQVRERPITTTLVAAGAGFLAATFLNRH